MDSPDQYMNIVYKPCGFAERTRPRMIFPHASGDNPLPCLVGPDGRGRVAGSGMTFLPCRR